jgi:NADPH2:quinone reductase
VKYVHIQTPGDASQLEVREGEIPAPKKGEILIRVVAAGVNRPDLLQRQGLYAPPPGASPILGLEVSGHVEKWGPGTQSPFQVGDAVCALLAGGGYAEYCVAPMEQCLPVPKAVSLVEAAGIC